MNTSAAASPSLPSLFPSTKCHHHHHLHQDHNLIFLKLIRPNRNFLIRVANESNQTEVPAAEEVSVGDRIVDSMDFGQLCDEFECISSPSVEATARQLVRDILELRQGNRALGVFATSVKYKDPVRSFSGRDKYKRPLWATQALDNPKVTVQEMVMLTTSLLSIKWTLKGKPKSLIGGDLVVKVHSKFILNQISGQVIQHEELWDLSASSFPAQAYFWASRRLFAASEAGKDVKDYVKDLSNRLTTENKNNIEMYPDPSGDPMKVQLFFENGLIYFLILYLTYMYFLMMQFFQRDDDFQRDVYQIALFLAVIYFVVEFLKTTL